MLKEVLHRQVMREFLLAIFMLHPGVISEFVAFEIDSLRLTPFYESL